MDERWIVNLVNFEQIEFVENTFMSLIGFESFRKNLTNVNFFIPSSFLGNVRIQTFPRIDANLFKFLKSFFC